MNASQLFKDVFLDYYEKPERPAVPKMRIEAKLILKDNNPIQFNPKRLGFSEKEKVCVILDYLLKRYIIRKSTSEYAFPIVLTRKKTGDVRMCIDYRTRNKVLVRDN